MLGLLTDSRSYRSEDLEALRDVAAASGQVKVTDGYVRFSQLPDALLLIALGPAAAATWWFSKGFFTKVGEELGAEVGHDSIAAYRSLKTKLREVVRRRQPATRPPLTMLTLEIERRGGGIVHVEGSSRAEAQGLDELLDSGRELLIVARVYAERAPTPERLMKLHFALENGAWQLRYGLDDQARRVMVAVMSDDRYAEMFAQAQLAADDGPP